MHLFLVFRILVAVKKGYGSSCSASECGNLVSSCSQSKWVCASLSVSHPHLCAMTLVSKANNIQDYFCLLGTPKLLYETPISCNILYFDDLCVPEERCWSVTVVQDVTFACNGRTVKKSLVRWDCFNFDFSRREVMQRRTWEWMKDWKLAVNVIVHLQPPSTLPSPDPHLEFCI